MKIFLDFAMLGPSGFFQTFNDTEFPDPVTGLEVIYDSESGFNVLYRVNKNGRFFVYKALKPEFRGNPFYEDLLRKDFNIGFKLTHTAICQYYAFVNLPETGNCIVMEWIDGCNLETLMAKGRLPKEKAEKIICEICDALEYMHKKQVIHRDLKPSNILVTYNGFNVKIIDFGLSDTDSYSSYKEPAGTRLYASPELIAGEAVDGRSDIWSLGIIIREITGYYSGIAAKCLKRDRQKRFQNAAEVKRAILKEGKRRLAILFSYSAVSLMAIIGTAALAASMAKDKEAAASDTALPASGSQEKPAVKIERKDTAAFSITQKPAATEAIPAAAEEPETQKAKTSGHPTDKGMDAASIEDLFESAIRQL